MRVSARFRAAQEILDLLLTREMSSKTIINWERGNKFAGSKDRKNIRDIVFHCLRNKRYFLYWWGKAKRDSAGRKLVLSYIVDRFGSDSLDRENDFFGIKDFDFLPLSDSENEILSENWLKRVEINEDPIKYSYPDFLDRDLKISLNGDFSKVMEMLSTRAPVYLRANKIKISTSNLIKKLHIEGFEVEQNSKNMDILKVLNEPKKMKLSSLFLEGAFEFQDLGSQNIGHRIPVTEGMKILDFCAGGGGKSLALASKFCNRIKLHAYDINSTRLESFKLRAKRSGAQIKFLNKESVFNETYDLILVDVPCSGTGTWRRDPFAKWNLNSSNLQKISEIQMDILEKVSSQVERGGSICYITCSLLKKENEENISVFLKKDNRYEAGMYHQVSPLEGGDGFFMALLNKIK